MLLEKNETVSQSTLRSEDLYTTFRDKLEALGHDMKELPELDFDELTQNGLEAVEWAIHDIMWAALQEYCPEGYYFGAHPGDGALFGCWEFEDETG